MLHLRASGAGCQRRPAADMLGKRMEATSTFTRPSWKVASASCRCWWPGQIRDGSATLSPLLEATCPHAAAGMRPYVRQVNALNHGLLGVVRSLGMRHGWHLPAWHGSVPSPASVVFNSHSGPRKGASCCRLLGAVGVAGTIQLGGKRLRSRCFRKPWGARGAGRYEARNERTTQDLRKQIEQARPTQLNRSG